MVNLALHRYNPPPWIACRIYAASLCIIFLVLIPPSFLRHCHCGLSIGQSQETFAKSCRLSKSFNSLSDFERKEFNFSREFSHCRHRRRWISGAIAVCWYQTNCIIIFVVVIMICGCLADWPLLRKVVAEEEEETSGAFSPHVRTYVFITYIARVVVVVMKKVLIHLLLQRDRESSSEDSKKKQVHCVLSWVQ